MRAGSNRLETIAGVFTAANRPLRIELFSCAGGMAEGFRRAGIEFDFAFDIEPDHCDSYEANIGHRPVMMDVRDLLRLVKAGFHMEVELLVADPPCTPWSRAGKRQGIEDERDMLLETCDLIRLLRPTRYLIGNVPGLDDSKNWPIVQRVIGGLAEYGYCVADFAALDAADYAVPQHRVRPFWFGHQVGPCIRWPVPTHGDPSDLHTPTLPGIASLLPWISCAEALGHLRGKDLGRPVKLRHRAQNSDQHGSIPQRPARVVGTSNLSDGNVMLPLAGVKGEMIPGEMIPGEMTVREGDHIFSDVSAPARALTRNTHGDGTVLVNRKHRPATPDKPAPALTAKVRTQSSQILVTDKHPEISADEPATTIRGGGEGHSAPQVIVAAGAPAASHTRRRGKGAAVPQSQRAYPADKPAPAVTTKDNRENNGAITIIGGGGAAPRFACGGCRKPVSEAEAAAWIANGHPPVGGHLLCDPIALYRTPSDGRTSLERHPPSRMDEPAQTIRGSDGGGTKRMLVLGEQRETTVGDIHHPPMYADEPAKVIRGGGEGGSNRALILDDSAPTRRKRPPSTKGPQWSRTIDPSVPAPTVMTDGGRETPSRRRRSILTMEGAVILSEKAAAILQGFPEVWVFAGKSKKRRWSQLGQAMPPPLAHAVATSVAAQIEATERDDKEGAA